MNKALDDVYWGSMRTTGLQIIRRKRTGKRRKRERERERERERTGSYKPHSHAILKPNTSSNRFYGICLFLEIDMSARGATMRETA